MERGPCSCDDDVENEVRDEDGLIRTRRQGFPAHAAVPMLNSDTGPLNTGTPEHKDTRTLGQWDIHAIGTDAVSPTARDQSAKSEDRNLSLS